MEGTRKANSCFESETAFFVQVSNGNSPPVQLGRGLISSSGTSESYSRGNTNYDMAPNPPTNPMQLRGTRSST
eukprot:scaffold2923_cov313-Pinguiococcus_pyrenoidosus.AAC.28